MLIRSFLVKSVTRKFLVEPLTGDPLLRLNRESLLSLNKEVPVNALTRKFLVNALTRNLNKELLNKEVPR